MVDQRGRLLESSGLYGSSGLQELRIPSEPGAPVEEGLRTELPESDFGEGLAAIGGELFQLTWKEGRIYVRDLDSFRVRQIIEGQGELWGAASQDGLLLLSDGSPMLRWIAPRSFRLIRSLRVREGGQDLEALNELEVAGGRIFANVYLRSRIVEIDPLSGCVKRDWDFSKLLSRQEAQALPWNWVLNGIAWDSTRQAFWITGKNWPALFLVRLEG